MVWQIPFASEPDVLYIEFIMPLNFIIPIGCLHLMHGYAFGSFSHTFLYLLLFSILWYAIQKKARVGSDTSLADLNIFSEPLLLVKLKIQECSYISLL